MSDAMKITVASVLLALIIVFRYVDVVFYLSVFACQFLMLGLLLRALKYEA